MPLNSLPIITDIPGLQQWRNTLSVQLRRGVTPRIPWNFQVSSKQGGNYLTWQGVNGADGYRVDVSSSGDFSTRVVTISLKGNQANSFFDTVPTATGSAPPARWYRVRATTGTVSKPQSTDGSNSDVLKSNAIAPNDTVTASSTKTDLGTTDDSQSSGSRGNYYLPPSTGNRLDL